MSDRTGKIVIFDGTTSLDIPAHRVLEAALAADLTDVVLVGYTPNDGLYFASSLGDGADTLWLLERAKLLLLRTVDLEDS